MSVLSLLVMYHTDENVTGDTWTYALGGMRYIPQGEALSAADMKNEVTLDKVGFLLLSVNHVLITYFRYLSPPITSTTLGCTGLKLH